MVGVSDHAGWAVLVTATADGTLVDRRRVTLVEDGLPPMPHHHEGQKLPLGEAVALVHRVDASAQRCARQLLDALTEQLDARLVGVALRACPALPPTVAERISDYRAMCVADWVMYRQAIASAARQRRWSVRWYEPDEVLADAARALGRTPLEEHFAHVRAALGPPWQKDHRLAMAAAIAAAAARP